MRKLVLLGAVAVLTMLFAQAVYAVYEPAGTVTLSSTVVAPGGKIIVSGGGFMVPSRIIVSIESDPVVLAEVDADATGAFSTEVTIPSDFSGSHTIVATGVAPDNSVRVLATPITVTGGTDSPDTAIESITANSNPLLTGFAVLGVILVSAGALVVLRGRNQA